MMNEQPHYTSDTERFSVLQLIVWVYNFIFLVQSEHSHQLLSVNISKGICYRQKLLDK